MPGNGEQLWFRAAGSSSNSKHPTKILRSCTHTPHQRMLLIVCLCYAQATRLAWLMPASEQQPQMPQHQLRGQHSMPHQHQQLQLHEQQASPRGLLQGTLQGALCLGRAAALSVRRKRDCTCMSGPHTKRPSTRPTPCFATADCCMRPAPYQVNSGVACSFRHSPPPTHRA